MGLMDKQGGDMIVFTLTDEIHGDVNEIYELLMDGEDDKIVEKKIDEAVKKLKELKESVIKKVN